MKTFNEFKETKSNKSAHDRPLNDNGEWEMTMDEWKKIHKDYKGTEKGVRTAMRMTSKGSTLIPVKIIKSV